MKALTQAYVVHESRLVSEEVDTFSLGRETTNAQLTQRYFELDALRVIAFGVLILYHIGMFYVLDWGWHIKSDEQFSLLQDVMILTNQWRMSLLFLISAMVFTVVLYRGYEKYPSRCLFSLSILGKRTLRILVPLLFGMFVIVAPQVFIEWTASGKLEMPFIDFYLAYINPNTDLFKEKQKVFGFIILQTSFIITTYS